MKKRGLLQKDVKHRQVKFLNNSIESDHASIKKLIVATGGLRVQKRAWSTIQGFELLRMFNKGLFDFWLRHDERHGFYAGEICLHESSFQY